MSIFGSLIMNGMLRVNGKTITNRIECNEGIKLSDGGERGILFDSNNIWRTYMASHENENSAPCNNKPSSFGDVNSWAIRNIVRDNGGTGNGFIWETAPDTSTNPHGIMALGANSGNLDIKGIFKSHAYGKISTFGCASSATWCHIDTEAPKVIINKPTYVHGDIYAGTNHDKRVWLEGDQVSHPNWSDYAELFPKDDINIDYKPSYIISLNPETNKYTYSTREYSKFSIGIVSNLYGILLGGKNKDNKQNLKENIPIGLCGTLPVYVTGKVYSGDLITTSSIRGIGMSSNKYIPGTIIGKSLSNKLDDDIGIIKILIFNC